MTVSLQILCFNTVVITVAANRTATKIKTTHCKRLIPLSKENIKLTEKKLLFFLKNHTFTGSNNISCSEK